LPSSNSSVDGRGATPGRPRGGDAPCDLSLDNLPWTRLAGPLAAAEDGLARLDERLRTSGIRDGFISRTHFQDACASLWLAGELVSLEDLVLHDARMDIHSPTHALTRAQAVLRARRRIAGAAPDWALSPEGLKALRGDGDGGPSGSRTAQGRGTVRRMTKRRDRPATPARSPANWRRSTAR
jgi:hypothetical protein